MKKLFSKKIIVYAICTALFLGMLPWYETNAADTTDSVERLYIEGAVTEDSKILFKVRGDDTEEGLIYHWYVGSSEESMKRVAANISDTYELTSGEDACIQVKTIGRDADNQIYMGASRIIQVKNASAEVDYLSGVTGTNASKQGSNDGKITGTTYDMLFYRGPDTTSGAVGGGREMADLAEGQYRVAYNDGVLKDSVLNKGLYAVYYIGTGGGVSVPIWKPGTEPTSTPPVKTEPTESPKPSTQPSASPGTDPGDNGNFNIQKPGTEITVGNVVYKSTSSKSLAYTGMKASGKSVKVPDSVKINGISYPVTELSSGAFQGSKVKNVKLGKNVKKIGKGAFKNCKSLKKITFSSKTQTIGAESFSGCTKLGSVSLPASVKTIGTKAFKNCKSLKKFKVGKTPVKTKSGKVIFGAAGGKKITIGARALENCIKLRSVIINSQVTRIGNATFRNCKKLASVLVKSLILKKVGKSALKGVNHCKISVPSVRLRKYRSLFKNKGQGKKVVIAKV